MADQLRLFVLAPSHYCERARWALDQAGLRYVEERLAVGLHVPRARRMAERTTLPILATGSDVIQGSGRILDWTRMTGGDPELERRFEDRVGVLVRQFIYAWTLRAADPNVRELLLDGVPAGQARLARLMWPLTRRLMIAGMNARAALLPELEAGMTAELDWFDARLDGRPYLVDGRFGRADLTAASLLAPLARPAECPLYRRIQLPEPLELTLARWASRPSLRWVQRIYADQRRPDGPRTATSGQREAGEG